MRAALLIAPALTCLPVLGQARINHARHGVASQSSTTNNGVAGRAIDGSLEGNFNGGSVTHTDNLPGTWWEVDLGARQDVLEIVLHNRADCCQERLSNFRVSLFDGASEVFGVDLHTAGSNVPPGGEHLLLPPATSGDRVRVQRLGPSPAGSNVLSLAEVEVLGPAPGLMNLAPLGVASQSSIGSGGTPERGNDGLINGLWTVGSITHTDASDFNSWWEVDLGQTWSIAEVLLHNRGDCCWTRLSNFRVSVWAGGFEVFGHDAFVGSGSVAQHDQYEVTLPPGIYGDMVRVQLLGTNNDGNGILSLSEVVVLGGAIGSGYCSSNPSSLGEPVKLAIHGSEDVAHNQVTLAVSNLPPGEMLLLFYGADQASVPLGDGTLCVAPGSGGWYHRLGTPQVVGPDGMAGLPLDLNAPPNPGGMIFSGSTWCFQAWFTDAGGVAGYGLSDAIEVAFQ